MKVIEDFNEEKREIEARLGYTFTEEKTLLEAFVHPSMRNTLQMCYERLEFMGDAAFELLVRHWLYRLYPDKCEGTLTKLKAFIVSKEACSAYIDALSLGQFLIISKDVTSNFGDLFEAILGAIYLDGGFGALETFFIEKLQTLIEKRIHKFDADAKTALQEYAQKHLKQLPIYTVLKEEGLEHNKSYTVAVSLEGKELGTGIGSSVKKAEKEAAKAAMKALQESDS